PVKLSPQQYAVFIVGALAIPQEWPAPVRTVAKVSPPPTPSGVVLPVVVPSPSWPLLLSPQQYAAPTVVMPQVFRNPALTAAKVSPPETAAGVELLVVVPLPSWPWLFSPQQYAAAALVTPQVWPNAVSYRLALSVWKTSPPETGTGTGVALPVVVPLPSSPSLLSPQQYAAPAVVTPQVWTPPVLSVAKVSPPETATGVELLAGVPSPSWP